MTDEELLIAARKVRRNVIRAERKIYYGHEPCAERTRNPRFDAAATATEKATRECNVIIDRINASRS
jgi:hypothetical protein